MDLRGEADRADPTGKVDPPRELIRVALIGKVNLIGELVRMDLIGRVDLIGGWINVDLIGKVDLIGEFDSGIHEALAAGSSRRVRLTISWRAP